jgi:eukaryotic-like serine/threonine-protein kinase
MAAADEKDQPTSYFGNIPKSLDGDVVTAAPSQAGVVLKGAYQIEAKLGEGGMGTVYRGVQLSLGRAVAIKTLSPSNKMTDESVQRFFREAKVLSQLNHPNVVTIIDFGTADPSATPFIVMELLQGKPLDGFVRPDARPPLRQILQMMSQICAGVAAAHQAKIIHRDLKPSNVFLVAVPGSPEPIVKILDFGLAKTATKMPASGQAITQAGVGLGTCGFTAPEQLEGTADPDERADVYGLGAILYFLLTGRPPYHGETMTSVLLKQMSKPPDPIDFPAHGLAGCEALEPVLHKAMSILPENRFQSVAEFKGALEAILTSILSKSEFHHATTITQTTAINAGLPTHVNPIHSAPTDIDPLGTIPAAKSRGKGVFLAVGGLVVFAGAIFAAWLAWKGTQGPTDGGGKNVDAKAALTASAPGVTTSDITLGLSAPFSGPAKELGHGMKVGIETYLRHVNDTGGIHGRKVQLLAMDDGYDPKRCLETMTEMIFKRPAFAFIGNVGTPTAEVSVPLVLENKRVLFGAFTGTGLLRRDPPDRYIFNYRPSYAEETAAIVHYLMNVKKIRPEQIAVFAQKDGYGDAGFNGVAKALRKAGFDADRIPRFNYERNSANIEEAAQGVLKLKDQIKAVVMVPTYGAAAAFIKRVRDEGMAPIFTSVSFVGSGALADALKETAPKYAQGVIVTQVVPFPESSASAVLQYRDLLKKYYPEEMPTFVSLEGYVAAKLLCVALEKCGPDLTSEKLVDAIESIRDLDFGLGTRITFGPSDHQGSHKIWATVLGADGKFQNLELE